MSSTIDSALQPPITAPPLAMLLGMPPERQHLAGQPSGAGAYGFAAIDRHARAPGQVYEQHPERSGGDRQPPSTLQGRRAECRAVDRLLEAARTGQSAALVVHGEPGIGKTALLEYAHQRASGFRVARATGVESEMELDFAALHQLCGQMLDPLERLPDPQRDALGAAFGLSGGGSPDRLFIGLALLTLLCEAAKEQPLLCVVDDAHRLDRSSAQALAFVARRLPAESVAMVFAASEPSGEFAGLPDLPVERLSDDDARVVLGWAVQGPLDVRVRDRLVVEARGNPEALLRPPYGLAPIELAGGFGLPKLPPLPGGADERFVRRRLAGLPAETRRLLLLSAAEPTGEPILLWRAAQRLGIEVDAAAPAEAAGLVQSGAQLRFLHPLVRSAIYRAGSLGDRQSVHRALAEVVDPEVDPDWRAWHRALASPAPDEEVAGELERSAGAAQTRAGLAAAAAFLEQAAALTPEPARRAERALAAAQAVHAAGAPDAALRLLAAAEPGPLDELQQARLERLRGQVAFDLRRGGDAPVLLLRAAKRLEPFDAGLARETYLDALEAAVFAGPSSSGRGVLEAAQAARAAAPAQDPPRAADLLLDGLATLHSESEAAGVPVLKRALGAFRAEDGPAGDDLRRLWPASRAAAELWDGETWHALATGLVQRSREAGALTMLPLGLDHLAALSVYRGEFAAASALIDEADAITATTGTVHTAYAPLLLAAWRGQEAQASALEAGIRDAAARGQGREIVVTEVAIAVLANGLGRYDAALAAAQTASERRQSSRLVLPELIEAAARAGKPELAASALDRLSERTQLSGTDWALGIEARSRALLSEGQVADDLYREAIDRLARCHAAADLARAHLLYGEWLRASRRQEAREQLRTAQEMLVAIGAEAFAARAARELLATGARKRTVEMRDQLTAQEARIAGLARTGLSNPQIGAQLFISPRTVEYHLRKVFTKLDISSRNQLDHALPDEATAAPPSGT